MVWETIGRVVMETLETLLTMFGLWQRLGFSFCSFLSSVFLGSKCLSVGMGFEEPWLYGGGGTLLQWLKMIFYFFLNLLWVEIRQLRLDIVAILFKWLNGVGPTEVLFLYSFFPFCCYGSYNHVFCTFEHGCGGHCIWNLIDMHVGWSPYTCLAKI